MYQDDPDLCWRLRLQNGKIACSKKSKCYHLKSVKNIKDNNLEMPVWQFYLAHARNRLRTLIKNYSYGNLFKRLLFVVFLIQLRALLLTIKNRNPDYLKVSIKGFFWNIYYLKGTLKERIKIQRNRKIPDSEIEKYMIKYSIEIWGMKAVLLKKDIN